MLQSERKEIQSLIIQRVRRIVRQRANQIVSNKIFGEQGLGERNLKFPTNVALQNIKQDTQGSLRPSRIDEDDRIVMQSISFDEDHRMVMHCVKELLVNYQSPMGEK